MTASRVLQLNSKDNVLVALSDLRQGEQIELVAERLPCERTFRRSTSLRRRKLRWAAR